MSRCIAARGVDALTVLSLVLAGSPAYAQGRDDPAAKALPWFGPPAGPRLGERGLQRGTSWSLVPSQAFGAPALASVLRETATSPSPPGRAWVGLPIALGVVGTLATGAGLFFDKVSRVCFLSATCPAQSAPPHPGVQALFVIGLVGLAAAIVSYFVLDRLDLTGPGNESRRDLCATDADCRIDGHPNRLCRTLGGDRRICVELVTRRPEAGAPAPCPAEAQPAWASASAEEKDVMLAGCRESPAPVPEGGATPR